MSQSEPLEIKNIEALSNERQKSPIEKRKTNLKKYSLVNVYIEGHQQHRVLSERRNPSQIGGSQGGRVRD